MSQNILQDKWQDYLFLTREMHKFLRKPDMDLFHALLAQRESLQKEIRKLADADGTYHALSEGQGLIRQVHLADQEMRRQFNQIYNSAKKKRSVAQAYDGMENYAGRYINQGT